MHFQAVADRCAVEMRRVNWSVGEQEALSILTGIGFTVVEVDVVRLARSLVGAGYRRGARVAEAPAVFDCSSLTKYIYARRGIRLPRRSIQQREFGCAVDPSDLKGGDLVFCSGYRDYYDTDPRDGVGHVGIAVGTDRVVHAANRHVGVVEASIDAFLGSEENLRGIRRIVEDAAGVVTLECPAERDVETSDDLRWIVLQQLP